MLNNITVNVDQVLPRMGRKILETDDLSDLTDSIKQNGIKVPPLVLENMLLVDGLRRLEVAKRLGWTTIEVRVAETFDEAIGMLEWAFTQYTEAFDESVRMLRAGEAYVMLSDLIAERYALLGEKRRGKKRHEMTGLRIGESSRIVATRAMGVANSHLLSRTASLVRVSQDVNDPRWMMAKDLVRQVRYGETSAERAARLVSEARGNTFKTHDLMGQRRILAGLGLPAETMSIAMGQLGELNPKLTRDELLGWERTLVALRSTLSTTINGIRHELQRRNDNA